MVWAGPQLTKKRAGREMPRPALLVLLLVSALRPCHAQTFNFTRTFTGLMTKLVASQAKLETTVVTAGCKAATRGTGTFDFPGLPSHFPDLTGATVDVSVGCPSLAWTLNASTLGGSGLQLSTTPPLSIAPYSLLIVDDPNDPNNITTNVTISTSVTIKSIHFQIQDSFSSPYTGAVRSLSFDKSYSPSGAEVNFGISFSTNSTCAAGVVGTGALSVSGMPAGLDDISDLEVNASVTCAMDGFSAAAAWDTAGDPVKSIAMIYGSSTTPYLAVTAIFGNEAALTGAEGFALSLDVSSTFPCSDALPVAGNGTLDINMPSNGLKLSDLEVDVVMYCLTGNQTGTSVSASASLDSWTYDQFTMTGVDVTITSGTYIDAATNATARYTDFTFVGSASFDGMVFNMTLAANHTNVTTFSASVDMAMADVFMSGGAISVDASFDLQYPCADGLTASMNLVLSGLDHGMPDMNVTSTLNASCDLRSWQLEVEDDLGSPSFDLVDGVKFDLGSPVMNIEYDKNQSIYLNFTIVTSMLSGTFNITSQLPYDKDTAFTVGGYFAEVAVTDLGSQLLDRLPASVRCARCVAAPLQPHMRRGNGDSSGHRFLEGSWSPAFARANPFALCMSHCAAMMRLHLRARSAASPTSPMPWTVHNSRMFRSRLSSATALPSLAAAAFHCYRLMRLALWC